MKRTILYVACFVVIIVIGIMAGCDNGDMFVKDCKKDGGTVEIKKDGDVRITKCIKHGKVIRTRYQSSGGTVQR